MFIFKNYIYGTYNALLSGHFRRCFLFFNPRGDIERFKLHPPWRLAQLFAFRYNSIVMNGFNVISI